MAKPHGHMRKKLIVEAILEQLDEEQAKVEKLLKDS
jgi:hypothetical protein